MQIPPTEQQSEQRKPRATGQSVPIKTQPIALLCAGGISQSWIAKLPRLVQKLGPVKAPTPGVARRIVNTLRHGWPVEQIEEFQDASWIFVAVPDESLLSTLDELASANLSWQGKTLVILDTDIDSQDLNVFTLRQAAVATVSLLDSYSDLRLVIQSDSRTTKAIRKFTEGFRVLELRPGDKGAFLAGLTLASSIAMPIFAACVESLTNAGFTASEAASIAEHSLSRTRRAFHKAGRKGWQGPLARGDMRAVRRQWESLRRKDSHLADYFLQSATQSLEYFRQDPRWVSELDDLPRRNPRPAPLLASASGDR